MTKLYSSRAMGAVRLTAKGKRLAGSSSPKYCLQFSKVAFDGPATSVGGIRIWRASQARLVASRTFDRARLPFQGRVSRRWSRGRETAGRVGTGLAGFFDLQDGMESETGRRRVRSKVVGRRLPIAPGRANARLSWRGAPFFFSVWRGRWRVQSALWDGRWLSKVNVLGEAWTGRSCRPVSAVAADEEGIVGKPGGNQGNQLDGQFGTGAMVGDRPLRLAVFGFSFFAFGETLAGCDRAAW